MATFSKASRRHHRHSRKLSTRAALPALMEGLEQRQLLSNSVVDIVATTPTAKEAATVAGEFTVTRTGGDQTVDLIVKIDVTGTATPTADYTDTLSTATVTIPADAASAKITITPVDDTTCEANETVIMAIATDAAYDIDGAKNTATVTITDNDLPKVSIAATDATALEGSGADTGTFRVTRTGPTTSALTVKYATAGSTATNGVDYNSLAGTVSIPIGSSTADITITTKEDTVFEGDETAILTLTTDAAYVVDASNKTATVTITDNDKPTVSIAATDATALEGSATDTGKYTITRTGTGTTAFAQALTVKFAVSGTSTDGTDFTSLGTSVVIAAGKTSADVILTTLQDTGVELSETAIVTLSDDAAYTVDATKKVATVTINDDDKPTISVTATDATASEIGASNTGKFRISWDGPTTASQIVKYAMSGTATSGKDYIALPLTATIPVGSSSVDIELTPLDDTLLEGSETIILTPAANAAYKIDASNKSATITIADDELPMVKIIASDPKATEGNVKDTGKFTISRNATLATALASALTVKYSVSGSATSGTNFEALSGTAVIPAGAASVDVIVKPVDDGVLKGTQNVSLQITSDAAYIVDPASKNATVNITDSEVPTVSIVTASDTAAEAARATGTYTVARTGSGTALADPLVVYLAIGGTAINGADYDKLAGTVTILATQSSATITVKPVDDSLLELGETVIVTLAAKPTLYTIDATKKAATLKITDNEKPTVKITAATKTTIEGSTTPAKFTVSRNGPTHEALTVKLTDDGGTATTDTDYTSLAATVTIPVGKASADVLVTSKANTSLDGNKTVMVTVATDAAYTVDGTYDDATVTIIDDEKPVVSVASTDTAASEAGPDTAKFTFTRTGPTTEALEVVYVMSGTAVNGTSYTKLTGKATIAAGDASVDVTLTPVDDAGYQGSRTAILTLAADADYTVDAANKTITATIADNDKPTVSIAAAASSVLEGKSTKFTVTRTGATTAALAVKLTIAGTATSATDYTAIADTVTIPAGRSAVDVVLAAKTDTAQEGDETVSATLAADAAYTVDGVKNAATVTITDTNLPVISIAATAADAVEGGADGTFTITRTGSGNAIAKALTVNLTITGLARNGVDYTTITQTATILATETTATVTIAAIDNATLDGPRTVVLTLANGTGYTIDATKKAATVTIADDELPTVSVVAIDATAAEAGRATGVFRIWRTGPTASSALSVKLDLTTGTATPTTDYTIATAAGTAVTDTVVIAAGLSYVDVIVTPVDDATVDAAETVILKLSTDAAYTLDAAAKTATVTITDND